MHVSKWPIFSPLFLTPIMYKKLELRKRSKGGGAKSLNFRGDARSLKGGEIPRDLAPGGPNPWGGKSLRHRSKKIEDEFHFLFMCPLYKHLRNDFLTYMSIQCRLEITSLSITDKIAAVFQQNTPLSLNVSNTVMRNLS